jgi:hypothetical protein
MIETKLCTIGCSSKYSKNEIIQALNDLYSLVNKDVNIENGVTFTSLNCYLYAFAELGMISRIILFLKNNINDASYCYHATELIHRYLYADYIVKSTDKLLSKFIQHGGIQILLLANDNYAKKGKTADQLRALENIWRTLTCTAWQLQSKGEEATEVLEKNQCISIFESCTKTMNMLKNDNNGVSCNDGSTQPDGDDSACDSSHAIAGYMFKTLESFIESKVITVNDTIGKNYFEGYVGFLMKDSERTSGDVGVRVGVWSEAARFFIACSEQKILSRGTKSDAKVLLHFCVGCNNKENYRFDYPSLSGPTPIRLLYEVSKIIGRKTLRETPGLMTTLGTLVDSNTADVDQYTKDRTYRILAWLCNPSRPATQNSA